MGTRSPVGLGGTHAHGSGKRFALQRGMTFGEIFKWFPKARLLAMRCLGDVDPVRDADLTVEAYARRFTCGWAFEMSGRLVISRTEQADDLVIQTTGQ